MALLRAADAAVRCLGVVRGDAVLIVCNPLQGTVARALLSAAERFAGSCRILEFPAAERPSQEPPAAVGAAMRRASVVFAATTFSISHTRARREATALGVRIATLPKISEELFARLLPVDYDQLERAGSALAARLTAADRVRITTAAGTDLALRLTGRAAICDAGVLQRRGSFGNLPAGEAIGTRRLARRTSCLE